MARCNEADTRGTGKSVKEVNDHVPRIDLYGWCVIAASMYLNFVVCVHFNLMSVFLEEFSEHFQESQPYISLLAGVRIFLVETSGTLFFLCIIQSLPLK